MLEDLEEVDLLYVQTLNSILHLEDSSITEQNFHEVLAPEFEFYILYTFIKNWTIIGKHL